MNTKIADHMSLLYTPKFWDPRKAYQWYAPDLTAAVLEGSAYARQHDLEPAHKLKERGAAMAWLTDLQCDFRDVRPEGMGRLPVTGADDVILRVGSRLINGFLTGHFCSVRCSRDGHPLPVHISYGTYFRTQSGLPLDLSSRKAAILVLADDKKCLFKATCFAPDGSPVDMGYVQPIYNPRDCVEYHQYLEKTGQLPQWAFAEHCALGTDGTNIHPFLAEIIAFCSGLRSFVPGELAKGHLVNTDWFGPLEPCRPDTNHSQGVFQKKVVESFKEYTVVEFSGVAQDFCDFWMKKQTLTYLEGTEHLEKLAFMSDGTAPIVPNAPHVLEQDKKAKACGVKFLKHDTPFGQYL